MHVSSGISITLYLLIQCFDLSERGYFNLPQSLLDSRIVHNGSSIYAAIKVHYIHAYIYLTERPKNDSDHKSFYLFPHRCYSRMRWFFLYPCAEREEKRTTHAFSLRRENGDSALRFLPSIPRAWSKSARAILTTYVNVLSVVLFSYHFILLQLEAKEDERTKRRTDRERKRGTWCTVRHSCTGVLCSRPRPATRDPDLRPLNHPPWLAAILFSFFSLI